MPKTRSQPDLHGVVEEEEEEGQEVHPEGLQEEDHHVVHQAVGHHLETCRHQEEDPLHPEGAPCHQRGMDHTEVDTTATIDHPQSVECLHQIAVGTRHQGTTTAAVMTVKENDHQATEAKEATVTSTHHQKEVTPVVVVVVKEGMAPQVIAMKVVLDEAMEVKEAPTLTDTAVAIGILQPSEEPMIEVVMVAVVVEIEVMEVRTEAMVVVVVVVVVDPMENALAMVALPLIEVLEVAADLVLVPQEGATHQVEVSLNRIELQYFLIQDGY